jgi:dCMP deaminase
MDETYYQEQLKRWDKYYYSVCQAIANKSPCNSRQIGCILVRDKIIISTGFNGPLRSYPHCLSCPRKAEGFKSGEGLHICPATHAEANCIASAARIGTQVAGCSLYLNCVIPCKDCMALIINAGIKEVVCEEAKPYHVMSLNMAKHANIKIREFVL